SRGATTGYCTATPPTPRIPTPSLHVPSFTRAVRSPVEFVPRQFPPARGVISATWFTRNAVPAVGDPNTGLRSSLSFPLPPARTTLAYTSWFAEQYGISPASTVHVCSPICRT